jgi:hypothetical protein
MSVETASRFIDKIYQDDGLRNKLNSEIGDITHVNLMDDSAAGNSFIKVASSYGYKFSLSDLQAAYQTALKNATYQELGQGELDRVAGGRASTQSASSDLCSNTLCSETC